MMISIFMILLRYHSLTTDKLKVLSGEMDPAEIIGSFDWTSLKREARKVFRKIRPSPTVFAQFTNARSIHRGFYK
jgi:hypothetical protein